MEKLEVGFVGTSLLVNTHHGAWRVRNAPATVAYYKNEKGKKLSFLLKVWRVLCLKRYSENGVRKI
jgi:hypothetical protein